MQSRSRTRQLDKRAGPPVRSKDSPEASHANLEALVQLTSDAIISVDEAQRITLFNAGAERLFGYACEEITNKSLDLLLPARFRKAHRKHIKAFSQSSDVSRMMGERREVFGLRKNGTEFAAEASITHLELGGRDAYTVILRDVSERKCAEAMLERQAEELRRSNSELEQFAYVASHDLQEPLRMVASYCQLLSKRYGDVLDADARDFIRYAVDGADRMQVLVNDLLAYSRVGSKEAEITPIACEHVVDQACRNLNKPIEESDTTIICDPLPVIDGDPGQLVQLFQNLIGNAIKYRSEEPPEIRISARVKNEAWEFAISDNGIGVEPEYFERIFIIFQRLHNRAAYSGTGIGLAVCKKIVERHGGRIWVESTPGQGSSFQFTFPTKKAVANGNYDQWFAH